MKIDDKIWSFVCDKLDHLMQHGDTVREMANLIEICPESPLVEPQFKMEELMVETLSFMIGDVFDSLSWFVYECNYGRRGDYKATVGNETRMIKSYDDLRWLIENDNDNNEV